ncbi:MAG TPA: hypothetical protein VH120_18650 [Gemmataceae bacterium]|nr:hypothetical protein [Gemmataceae bacterium]
MDDDPEVIRHQMQETRSSLTDKIERLEQTVTDKVQATTTAVTDTVTSVKEAVQDTVESVKGTVAGTVDSVRDTVNNTVETVKETFDVRRYFRDYPWAALGASVGAGFLGGMVLGSGSRARGDRITNLRSRGQSFTGPSSSSSYRSGDGRQGGSYTAPPAHAEPGWTGEIASRFGDELGKLKGVALGAAFGLVRDWIGRSAPGEVSGRIAEVIDEVTRKFGGEPIRGNLLETFSGFAGGSGKSSRERETSGFARTTDRSPAGENL